MRIHRKSRPMNALNEAATSSSYAEKQWSCKCASLSLPSSCRQLPGRPNTPSCAAQIAKAMAGARLADEILTHMGDFLDDPGLCALACSERMRWDRSSLQRQTRKDEQLLFLQLRGHAECPRDCERAAGLLGRIWIFVSDCFWGAPCECRPGVFFHIEFVSRRCDLPQLHRAVKNFSAQTSGA